MNSKEQRESEKGCAAQRYLLKHLKFHCLLFSTKLILCTRYAHIESN